MSRPASSRGRSMVRPTGSYRTPPDGSMEISDLSPRPQVASTLPPAPGRPSSSMVLRGRPTPPSAMNVYRPRGGSRPTSAPGAKGLYTAYSVRATRGQATLGTLAPPAPPDDC